MTTEPNNPSAPTTIHELPPSESEGEQRRPLTLGRMAGSLLVWTLVCTLSAAPSFAIAISDIAQDQAAAMILGVILFIAMYTTADVYTYSSKLRRSRRMRIILRSTFILRSLMVVLYPVAVFTDIILGMFSVSFVGLLFRLNDPAPASGPPQLDFAATLVTTLVQGTLLSLLLLLLGAIIAGIIAGASFLFGSKKRHEG